MNQNLNHDRIMKLVLTAFFMALVLLLGFTPIGMIPLGFINASILCTPVIVGTLLLGWKPGLLLGLCFGAVSAINAILKPTALVAPLMARSPALTMVMCFLPRLLVPLTAYLVYRAAKKHPPEFIVVGLILVNLVYRVKGENADSHAVTFAAVVGSLTNTVFYLGLMLLFYVVLGIDAKAVLGLIGGTGLIAGGTEAVIAAVICTPVLAALRRVQHK